jgi:hypothetical protein
VRIVRRFTDHLRNQLDNLMLAYLDDVIVGPSLGRAATANECRLASRQLDQLLKIYGLTRRPTKGTWGSGSTRLEHWEFCRGDRGGDLRRPREEDFPCDGEGQGCSSLRRGTGGW